MELMFPNAETAYQARAARSAPLALRAVAQYGTPGQRAAARAAGRPASGDQTAHAVVNHGRWIVACPAAGCGGAQYAHPDAPTYFCLTCGNAAVAGRLVAVRFPRNAERIEAYLGARPHAHARHWKPGETLADLRAENRARGLRLS